MRAFRHEVNPALRLALKEAHALRDLRARFELDAQATEAARKALADKTTRHGLVADPAFRRRAAKLLTRELKHPPTARLVDVGALAVGLIDRAPEDATAIGHHIPELILAGMARVTAHRLVRDNEPIPDAVRGPNPRATLRFVLVVLVARRLADLRWAGRPEMPTVRRRPTPFIR